MKCTAAIRIDREGDRLPHSHSPAIALVHVGLHLERGSINDLDETHGTATTTTTTTTAATAGSHSPNRAINGGHHTCVRSRERRVIKVMLGSIDLVLCDIDSILRTKILLLL